MCRMVARKGMASFVSLSALVSEIFKETLWEAVLPPPPNGGGRGLSVSRFKVVKFQISASKTTLFRG